MSTKSNRRIVLAVYGLGSAGTGHATAVAWMESGHVLVALAVALASSACVTAIAEAFAAFLRAHTDPAIAAARAHAAIEGAKLTTAEVTILELLAARGGRAGSDLVLASGGVLSHFSVYAILVRLESRGYLTSRIALDPVDPSHPDLRRRLYYLAEAPARQG